MTRDGVRAEGLPGGYGPVYSSSASSRRSASAAVGTSSRASAAPGSRCGGAVERLRESGGRTKEKQPEPLVLAAADPAQPYGAALPWPRRVPGRAARVAGDDVVLLVGDAALYVERGGGRSAAPDPEKASLHLRSGRARRARAALRPAEASGSQALRRGAGRESRGACRSCSRRAHGRATAGAAAPLRPCPRRHRPIGRRRGWRFSQVSELIVEACIRGPVRPESPSALTACLEAVEAHGKTLLLRFEAVLNPPQSSRHVGNRRTMAARRRARRTVARADRRAGESGAARRGSAGDVGAPCLGARAGHPRAKLDSDAVVANLRRVDQGRAIGEALLDQRVVAGIGNIWRSEALWHARVSPWLPLADLDDAELHMVVREAARLMAESRDGGNPRREDTGVRAARAGAAASFSRPPSRATPPAPSTGAPACQRGEGPAGA